MTYYRSLFLAAGLAGGLALPALAQTAAPAPAPQADASAPMPDAGVKKAPPAPTKHTHHAHKASKPANPAKKR